MVDLSSSFIFNKKEDLNVFIILNIELEQHFIICQFQIKISSSLLMNTFLRLILDTFRPFAITLDSSQTFMTLTCMAL
jgi:hypothetical protein